MVPIVATIKTLMFFFLFLSLWAASLRVEMGLVLGELELKSNFLVVICAFCFYWTYKILLFFCWFVFRMDFYGCVSFFFFYFYKLLVTAMISGSVFLKGLVQLVTINFRSCWNQRALDLKLFWAMKKSAFQSFVEFLFFFFLISKNKKE